MIEALRRAPTLRRVPGGWVGFHEGAAWPVSDPDGVALAPGARWFFDGEGLSAFPGDGPVPAAIPWVGKPVEQTQPVPRRPASSHSAMPGMWLQRGAPGCGAAPSPPGGFLPAPPSGFLPAPPGGVLPALSDSDLPAPPSGVLPAPPSGDSPLLVPRAWLERLVLMPAIRPLPFAPPGVAGLALAESAVLLLEGPAGLPLLAVLRVEGRLLGLGCSGARPDADAGDGGWLPAGALALAPHAPEFSAASPAPSTALLFCQAGGLHFALPALEVEAVLAPLVPTPAPADPAMLGVVAHRGQVLPVLDGGTALGGAAALTGVPVPMLRLAGPVALAVSVVEGLRRVADTAISPSDAGGPIRATCWPAGVAIPVLDPAWLTRGVPRRVLPGTSRGLEVAHG